MNRRGNDLLTNNTLGAILAVFALALFFYAAWQVYQVNIDQDAKKASDTLDSLVGKIGRIDQRGSISLLGVKGWSLVGWSEGQDRPDKCLGSCLCVCPIGPSGIATKDTCQKGGFCRVASAKDVYVRTMNYHPSVGQKRLRDILELDSREMWEKRNKRDAIWIGNTISFDSVLHELYIRRRGDQLDVLDVAESNRAPREYEFPLKGPITGIGDPAAEKALEDVDVLGGVDGDP